METSKWLLPSPEKSWEDDKVFLFFFFFIHESNFLADGLKNRTEFRGGIARAFKAISARISLSDTNNPMGQQDGPFRIRRRINEGPAIPWGCYLIPVDLLILRLVLGKAQCGFHVALDYPYFFAGLEGPPENLRAAPIFPTFGCLFQPEEEVFQTWSRSSHENWPTH